MPSCCFALKQELFDAPCYFYTHFSGNIWVSVLPFRPQPFPKKYSALPGIGSNSPVPNEDNQMIPYGNSSAPSRQGEESADRVQQLEARIAVAEKSNRALLEECVRLQVQQA